MKRLLINLLRQCANDLENDSCSLTEQEISNSIDYIGKLVHGYTMSKAQACSYLKISRSSFDNLVKIGVLPRGKKVMGFKELRFYKSDLDKFKEQSK